MAVRLDVVGIVAGDMARSLTFYRDLGLDIPADADNEPHVEVVLPGGFKIDWDTIETMRSFDPDWSASTGRHPMSLAFACDSPEEVDATYERLTRAGHHGHLAPWDAFWGMRYAVLHDPDGNTVDLFSDLPT